MKESVRARAIGACLSVAKTDWMVCTRVYNELVDDLVAESPIVACLSSPMHTANKINSTKTNHQFGHGCTFGPRYYRFNWVGARTIGYSWLGLYSCLWWCILIGCRLQLVARVLARVFVRYNVRVCTRRLALRPTGESSRIRDLQQTCLGPHHLFSFALLFLPFFLSLSLSLSVSLSCSASARRLLYSTIHTLLCSCNAAAKRCKPVLRYIYM